MEDWPAPTRNAVLTARDMVAANHPAVANLGAQVLSTGGNAIDGMPAWAPHQFTGMDYDAHHLPNLREPLRRLREAADASDHALTYELRHEQRLAAARDARALER